MINICLFVIVFSFLIAQDSLNINFKDFSNLKKSYNLNLIPTNDHDKIKSKKYLYEGQLEQIREHARNFKVSPVKVDDIVVLETSRGNMKLKLFPDIAPNHCNNFKKLANSGFYDETGFHRLIPGFMIQGGDINSRDANPKNDGRGGPGWTVDAEFNDKPHKRGTLSMARSRDINSAGSQFFICAADAPHLDGNYTVFGEVIEGDDVIDKIVGSATEYSDAKRKCVSEIPKNSTDIWVKVLDPKTRQPLYSKLPEGQSKDVYKRNLSMLLSSDRPLAMPRITKARVISKGEYIDEK